MCKIGMKQYVVGYLKSTTIETEVERAREFNRITEYPELEGTYSDDRVQPKEKMEEV